MSCIGTIYFKFYLFTRTATNKLNGTVIKHMSNKERKSLQYMC